MALYSAGYRKCCNSYIAFISVSMFILSVFILIIGFIQEGTVVPPESKNFGLDISIS